MRTGSATRNRTLGLVLSLSLALVLIGCTPAATPAPTPVPTATHPSPQRLRVRNAGTTTIKGLMVGFGTGWIEFGDIAPGSTTEYKTVPNGVLRYAAYSFQMDGRETGQAVMDFMGEQPMPGIDFTYSVDYDPARWSQNEAVKLLGVTTDR